MTKDLENLARILRDPLSGLTWDNRIMAANAIDNLTAALEAQLAERVRVKPLQWNECRALYGGRKLVATDCFGREYARLDLKGQPDDFINDFKARVQEAYNTAILSALEPAATCNESLQVEPAAPEGQEPVAYRIHAPEDDYYGTGADRLQFHPLTQYDLDNGYRQTPLYTRPTEQAVTEAMVEAASREYMRIFNKHLLSKHARLILTAAQEAGKP